LNHQDSKNTKVHQGEEEIRTAAKFALVPQEVDSVAKDIVDAAYKLSTGYKLDLLVDDLVIVELKAVEDLLAIHHAQLISYLRHSRKRLGLLINFNVPLIKDGIRRVVCD